MSDLDDAREMLALEQRARRRLSATSLLTLRATRGHTHDTTRSALSTQMAATVLDVRTKVRSAAAEQFTRATGLAVTPSGANDRPDARRAGAAVAKAYYVGGGGTSGGGGSSDAWDEGAARDAVTSKIARVAAYEVAHAWNDEHRRNADALPEYRFRERWCAILDTHLCIRCRRMNGRLADKTGQFAEGWPPAHPGCRCVVITTVI